MRLHPKQRSLIADARRRGIKISHIAEVCGVSTTTIKRWIDRRRFQDKKRKPKESKILPEIELAILAMRTLFEWEQQESSKG